MAAYLIDRWGAPYFTANSVGNFSVRPRGSETLPHQQIDLLKVVEKVTDPEGPEPYGGFGLRLPLIVRFPEILKNRLECLQSAFDDAIQSQGYESHYQGVYPVKCNQDRLVVEDIVEFGSPFLFGLEAGSKSEILLAMTCLCKAKPGAFLVCNGFKDADYISLALLGRRLGLNTVIVLEQVEELDLVIERSEKMKVKPVIGIRAKLKTKHSGHFGSSSGDKGKFGLTPTEIIRVVRTLEQRDMLDCLQVLHFHIGSQIPSTLVLSDAVTEAAQLYCNLLDLGASMRVIDVGGGLGIDYDGSKSGESNNSVFYNLVEYADAVVEAVRLVCDRNGVEHPVICSESGRAIVSHHSMLIFDALSASESVRRGLDKTELLLQLQGNDEAQAIYQILNAIRGEYKSCLDQVDQLKPRILRGFREGLLRIQHLAALDGLCELVLKNIGAPDLRTYLVNLSVFTSIPDFWGIDQVFPIVPIHKLHQCPMANGILSDLTCDSDGKVNEFIGGESSLPLHELDNDGGSGRYYLGMFLGGAYEEALGGVHNLFGKPSVARVMQRDGPNGFEVTQAMPGQSCSDVLRTMQYDPDVMIATLTHLAEELNNDNDGGEEDDQVAALLERAFNNMPYLVTEPVAADESEILDN